jgi:hypothetical protein
MLLVSMKEIDCVVTVDVVVLLMLPDPVVNVDENVSLVAVSCAATVVVVE